MPIDFGFGSARGRFTGGGTGMASIPSRALGGFTEPGVYAPDPNSLGSNMARGEDVRNQRRQEIMDNWARRQGGGPDLGMLYGTGMSMDFTPWGDFYTALVGAEANGKRINTKSIGRTKSQDVPTGRVYDTQGGELAPGLRDKGGWYTPEEFSRIGQAGLEGLRRAQRQAIRRR